MSENNSIIYLTKGRFQEIEKEIEHLKKVERPLASQRVGIARDHGDLSENAEYDAAKEEQQLLENRILSLEKILLRAQIIHSNDLPNDKVYILSKVKLFDKKKKKEVTYMLVSQEEANIEKGKISISSPLGKSLLGKKVGETVEVKAPVGIIEYKILEIGK